MTQHCEGWTTQTVDKAQALLDALSDLDDPQVGLCLMRHCVGFSKLVYSMRATPAALQEIALLRYDDHMRNAFTFLTGLNIDVGAWGQATRGFAHASIGLRACAVMHTLLT